MLEQSPNKDTYGAVKEDEMIIRIQGLVIVLLGVLLLVSRIPITGSETGVAAWCVAAGMISILGGGASIIILGDE